MPQDDSRRRSNQSRLEEMKRVKQIEEFGQETNLIVQVQSTHLDRLVEYLHRWNNSQNSHPTKRETNTDTDIDSNSCRVLGSTKANSKNVSVLFLSCDNPTSLARKLYMDPLLARAINKSYIVQPGVLLKGNLATEQGCNEFAKILFDNVSQTHKEEMILRMSVFPPKQQSRLLQSFDLIVNDDSINAARQLTIAPKGFSHMLSVVEVYQDKGRGWERRQQYANNKLYMIGVSPASLELDVVDTNNIMADDGSDNVNRAYYKLKEAIEMYEASGSHGKLHQDFYDGSIALDCGSSPGGWTKYLIEHFGCQKVYSIDPGELAPSVLELKEASHMQMKIQDALPLLLENEAAKGQVKIWVSDMCLHNMEDQANLLLLAKEKGLLASKTFFVLTLKCVVGRSKLSYDSQVGTVVDAFCASANIDSLEIFHLFSNRSGERTVIGCIN
eukprot:CAMPEP_0201943910 /NCGR_PEP_ID=MMETSP0903-20130614/52086_1 /ASSEMBLY_ACC=CAM_ASM_000552 /TAXON_ID=420261 /ORGANISM="Thalassiosira antarctica, Strain CCMP982" /LENGTH=442 /DNA_ID=CAMNT_0048486769 /DNA_START=291 /DNA_END=1619 /DNA_ORIENTATION=-